MHLAPAILAAWLLYLATDFLTHAVLLSRWWTATGAYWLAPAELFRRVPLGYASFAIWCGALVWLLARLDRARTGAGRGAAVGTVAGAVYGLSVALAVASVFEVPWSLLVVWPASWTVGSAAAGAAGGAALASERPWRTVGSALAVALACFVVGVVLQSTVLPTGS